MTVPSKFYDAVDRASPEKLVRYFNNYCKRNISDIRTHCFSIGSYGWEGVTMFLPDRYDDMVTHLNKWSYFSFSCAPLDIERPLCLLSAFLLKEPNALGIFIADSGCGATITPAIMDNTDIPDYVTDYFSEAGLNRPINVWPNFRHHIADVLWHNSTEDEIPSNFK